MATLTLQDVGKVYDNDVEAVSGLDLFVSDGEFVVLVGPSGCGKTTVLRMVAGLEEISSGEILLESQPVSDLSPRERDVAMVFQTYALYPHLSVHENIAFSLSLRNVPKPEREKRVRSAAAQLGLSDLLNAKPRQLSGGQRQRVAMGRALVREPAVFLMDEPLSNLDARLRVQMRTEVLAIQRRLGVATLYVTHDQTEAMTMGDRVAVMNGGVLQQVAPPREIYDRPANVFVAAFMGSPSMNLYVGALAADLRTLRLGSHEIVLPDGVRRSRPTLADYAGSELVVGIRPEHLSVRAGDDAVDKGTSVDCQVELVEELGNELLLHFSSDMQIHADGPLSDDGDDEPSARIVPGSGVGRAQPNLRVAAGDRITLAIDVEQLHFFEPQTGQALAYADAVVNATR